MDRPTFSTLYIIVSSVIHKIRYFLALNSWKQLFKILKFVNEYRRTPSIPRFLKSIQFLPRYRFLLPLEKIQIPLKHQTLKHQQFYPHFHRLFTYVFIIHSLLKSCCVIFYSNNIHILRKYAVWLWNCRHSERQTL